LRKKTIEDYIELIYDLQKGKKRVHTNDIASVLDINPASVTEIFQKLSDEKYIDYEKYSGVTLTDKGKKVAKDTKIRHDALKEFLRLLGVTEEIAEKDACEMEHILHKDTMDAVIKFVEVIKMCQVTPFWLERLNTYIKTGKLSECPPELVKICLKYSKKEE
jgi:DtxR family Mn-dependent transcriptional regulator